MSKPSSSKKGSQPPPAKKTKVETLGLSDEESTSGLAGDTRSFLAALSTKREQCAKDILSFKFNKKRCRLLSKSMDIGENGGGILYWMSREQRVQGLWNFQPLVNAR